MKRALTFTIAIFRRPDPWTTTSTSFSPASPEAVDALEKLNKKAVRYGAEPVTWTLGEPREEKVQTQDGRTVKVMYVELTLSHVEAPLRWGLPVHRPA